MAGKICEICGYEAKHQGALNMHKYHCRMKNMKDGFKEVARTSEGNTVIEPCQHNMRLLNINHPVEKQAFEAGYKGVCTKCQHLTN